MYNSHESLRFRLSMLFLAVILVAPVVSAQGTLFVENDKVGIGVQVPTAPLHVRGDGSASIFVQDVDSTVAPRILFLLENNGPTKFRLNNLAGSEWNFQASNTGFVVSQSGTGGAELFVANDGAVQMGFGGSAVFDMDSAGHLSVTSLTETSSIDAKTGFESLDATSVLDRVLDLGIQEWSYADDAAGARHVGPVAEEFFAAFALGGDGKHIAPRDLAGVALVALQELHRELELKQDRIAQLQALQEAQAAKNEELEQRLAELESRLAP